MISKQFLSICHQKKGNKMSSFYSSVSDSRFYSTYKDIHKR